ncbi:chitin synthase III catalytic subunit-domain-containing protein [Globomyces pollinis-pini]|nr:chitin synthase III catalytic subunit-domain-containing protein [Globomyces pollinis-pini]
MQLINQLVALVTLVSAYEWEYYSDDAHGHNPNIAAINRASKDQKAALPKKVFAPYINVELPTPYDLAAADDKLQNKWFTLGFINSDGNGKLMWPKQPTLDSTVSNPYYMDTIKKLRAKGGDVIFAFGGYTGGQGTAKGSDIAMNINAMAGLSPADKLSSLIKQTKLLIDTYEATWIDYDIEVDAIEKDNGSIDLRNKALAQIKKDYPKLRISFTIPCFPDGLSDSGKKLLENTITNNFRVDVINLMTMDFGTTKAPDGKNGMGKYSIAAAQNVKSQAEKLGIDFKTQSIGITPMIGNNDVQGEVFTEANAQEVVDFANGQDWVSYLSFWALHRDDGAAITETLDISNQVTATKYAYANIFTKYKLVVDEPASGGNDDTNTDNTSNPTSPTSSKNSFKFGSFDSICDQLGLSFCTMLRREPLCYARDLELGISIFQPATIAVHFVSLIMTIIMIKHVNVKYTAIGRKEMVMFFRLFALTTIVEVVVMSGIVPLSLSFYPVLVALHSSLVTATLFCLFMNGFVPFQFVEDGTSSSLWLIRLSTIIVFAISYFVNIATFKSLIGFSPTSPLLLWILYVGFNTLLGLGYFITQIVVVFRIVEDRTPLFDILLAGFFAILSQILGIMYSEKVCNYFEHYIDGLFLTTIFNLLAVMMIYKYWDGITKEDLEFAVGAKNEPWEVRDPLISDSAMAKISTGFNAKNYRR